MKTIYLFILLPLLSFSQSTLLDPPECLLQVKEGPRNNSNLKIIENLKFKKIKYMQDQPKHTLTLDVKNPTGTSSENDLSINITALSTWKHDWILEISILDHLTGSLSSFKHPVSEIVVSRRLNKDFSELFPIASYHDKVYELLKDYKLFSNEAKETLFVREFKVYCRYNQ